MESRRVQMCDWAEAVVRRAITYHIMENRPYQEETEVMSMQCGRRGRVQTRAMLSELQPKGSQLCSLHPGWGLHGEGRVGQQRPNQAGRELSGFRSLALPLRWQVKGLLDTEEVIDFACLLLSAWRITQTLQA